MVIDIISYTEEQLAALPEEQLMEVRQAQLKKNTLEAELRDRLKTERGRLIDRGVFPSTIWKKREAELTAECEEKIEIVRDALLFYLHYVNVQNGTVVPPEVPYPVDYSLSVEARTAGVRDYYLAAYTDAQERFDRFAEDEFARTYLGELYGGLFHYFHDLIVFGEPEA